MSKYIYILILLLLGCESNTFSSLEEESVDPNSYFSHNISNKVAFYFFESIKISENNLSSDDWIGAFKGQICVGARRWTDCNNGTACDIPIYGQNDLNELTAGYMLPNEIPNFIIYDASEEIYYDAISSDQIPWQDGIFPLIDSLSTG